MIRFTRIATLAVAAVQLLLISESQAALINRSTFVGPGVMECDAGECEFTVDPSLGCADPCHTQTHEHIYDLAFKHVADTNSNVVVPGGQVCYAKQAKNIVSSFPNEYVAIEAGCTAKCTGCSFAPTIAISGPAKLKCRAGRCFAHTTKRFDCGNEIAAASRDWGSFETVVNGDDETNSFHGFEHIGGRVRIPDGCDLECSRCNPVADGLRNFRVFRNNDPW